MSKKYKLVCFDMDGTLIRNTNSVEYLCRLCNKVDEVFDIDSKDERGEITWIEADYLKAKLFHGLELKRVKIELLNYIKVISNLDVVLARLKQRNIKAILVTAGPTQVADALNDLFGFDKAYGSTYEVLDGHFTGNIIEHLGDTGKLECLKAYCHLNEILMEEVVSIGDGISDFSVFEKSGKSIAINYSEMLIGKADEYLMTDDLLDIMQFIA